MKKLTLLIFAIALLSFGCKDDKEVVYIHQHDIPDCCTCGIVVDKYPLDTFVGFELKNLCSDNMLLAIETVGSWDDKEIADTVCVNHKW